MAKSLLLLKFGALALFFTSCSTPDPIIRSQPILEPAGFSADADGEWESIPVPAAAPVSKSDDDLTLSELTDFATAPSKTTPAAVRGSRTHVLRQGETLMQLARRYYQDASKWRLIHQANRDKIQNPNVVFVGQELLIP